MQEGRLLEARYRKLTLLWLATFIGVMVLAVIALVIPLEEVSPNQQFATYFLYAAWALFFSAVVIARSMPGVRPLARENPRANGASTWTSTGSGQTPPPCCTPIPHIVPRCRA